MAFKIDATGFDNKVSSVVNSQNTKIQTAIENFNLELEKLGNGSTWIGGSAETNIGQLVSFYNTYKTSYETFVTKLKENCSGIFEHVNGIIQRNNGTPLIVTDVASLSFGTPNIKDLSYANGESGDVTTMKSCATNLTTYADDIKNGYLAIKTAFEENVGIVAGSVLDLSDRADDPATALKNGVVTIITDLQTIDEKQFKDVITNINNAALNIERG